MKTALVLFLFLTGCATIGTAPVESFKTTLPSGTAVTLLKSPCKNKQVLEYIEPGYHSMWQAGHARTVTGDEVELCWSVARAPDGATAVLIIDARGGAGVLNNTKPSKPDAL